jgi:hypothetical protein
MDLKEIVWEDVDSIYVQVVMDMVMNIWVS